MKSQKGSLLAGALGMATLLMVASSGFLYLVSNSDQDGSESALSQRRFFAAESGLLMGITWLRAKPYSYIQTSGPDSIPVSGGYQSLDGWSVEVVVRRDAALPGLRTVKSRATQGAGKDTLELTWRVEGILSTAPELALFDMGEWKQTLKPGT